MITIIYCNTCAPSLERDYHIKKTYFSDEARCRWCGKLGSWEIECTDKK